MLETTSHMPRQQQVVVFLQFNNCKTDVWYDECLVCLLVSGQPAMSFIKFVFRYIYKSRTCQTYFAIIKLYCKMIFLLNFLHTFYANSGNSLRLRQRIRPANFSTFLIRSDD